MDSGADMASRSVLSRRRFLIGCTIAARSLALWESFPLLAAAKSSSVIAGAIRWDAWYQDTDISVSAQESLSPERYFRRAPFFCSINSAKQVHCLGTPEAMDAEIHAAVKGGLKY